MELTTLDENNYPAIYNSARTSLIECAEIDECKDWVDKAAAMEMYARQANDDTLLKMAMRIKLRASKKAGELLNAVPSGTGKEGGQPSALNKKDLAEENGISQNQAKTYQRIANVPDDEFEQQVESDTPPTMTALADQGKKSFINKINSTKDFPIHWVGALNRLVEQSKKIESDGLNFYEQHAEVAENIEYLKAYFGDIL